jgi:hypothetical protein
MMHTARPLRGFSFPIVILLISVLAAAAAASVVVMASSARTTGSAIDRRRTFYGCDGIARAAAVAARPYLSSAVAPDTNGLRTAVCGGPALPCANRASFDVPPMTVNNLKLDVIAAGSVASPVPNGPFRGMNALQNKVEILVDATNTRTGSLCRVRQTMTLGEIGLFQFVAFADGYQDSFPTANLDLNGRVHTNGDFCAHSASTLTISQLTSAGRVLASCSRFDPGGGSAFFVRDSTSTAIELNSGCENGCVNCGTAASCGPDPGDWRSFALARWDGNLQDAAHNVPKLRLPLSGAPVQDGLDASGAGLDNSTSMRALVDPPRATDDAAILAQRYAMKADIRIIDGVWFKNDGTWPGTPIWSDHAGSFTPAAGSAEEQILSATGVAAAATGQKELFCDTSTAVPRGYSYYAHDCAIPGAMLAPRDGLGAASTRAVVSYGSLVRDGAPLWFPGVGATRADGVVSEHLRATRAGFQDLRMRDALGGGDTEKYRMLPMNIDVGALAAALADASGAELGAHFAPGTFGGVIYIASSWPTVLDGASSLATVQGPAPLWPTVHDTAGADPGVPDPASFAIENDRLPRALCASGATPRSWAAGWSANACGGAGTVFNSVRIINASTLDPVVFPRGLSIVTHLPAYVVGDTNTGSVAASGLPAPAPTLVPSGNWRPLMIGADAITLLSSAWSDANADWGDPHDGGALGGRVPSATTWVLSALHGNVETSNAAAGGGLEGSARFLEHWNGTGARIYGSMVIGFRSVLQRQPYVLGNVSSAPALTIHADARLAAGTDAPPGAPSFFVQATEAWTRN